jgi:hypothetical protein
VFPVACLQLAPIPADFTSPAEYSRAFIWFVAEEVRAQLHQALLALSSNSSSGSGGCGPAVPVQDVSLSANAKKEDAEQNMHEVAVTVSCSSGPQPNSNSSSSGGSSSGQQLRLPFKPTDLLLLSSTQVGCIDDLKQPGCSPWMLALVTGTPGLDQQQQSAAAAAAAGQAGVSVDVELKVKVWAVPGSPELEALSAGSSSSSSGSSSGRRGSWWAYALGSLATPMRAFNALQQLADVPLHRSLLLRELLLHNAPPAAAAPAAGSSCIQAASSSRTDVTNSALLDAQMSSAVLSYCQQCPALNPSQQQIVLQLSCSPAAAAAGNGQAIRLVQGPPGTGKTATVTRLLSVLGCSGVHVLACAPTNVAVCELATRYLQLLQGQRQFADHVNSSSISGYGSSSSSMGSAALQQLSSGDVLLVGNEERLELSDALAAVFLPGRVQRLMGVAGPMGVLGTLSELRRVLSAQQLADFRQQCRQQEASPSSSSSSSGIDGSGSDCSSGEGFASFLASRLRQLHKQLQRQLQVVVQDLPSQISQKIQHPMQQAVGFLEQILSHTTSSRHNNNSSSTVLRMYEALEAICGPSAAFDASPDAVTQAALAGSSTHTWVTTAVQLLQAVRAAQAAQAAAPAALQQRPNARALRQFCLSSCRHLFCTVSTVGSGVMADAGVFPVVVADEAAQLVEAEAAILLARSCGCSTNHNTDSALQHQPQPQQPVSPTLVLVGDPKQLPATVISQRAAQQGYSRSLFERLQQRGSHVALLLDTQYRCRPEISLWPCQRFYGGQLQDGANVCEASYGAALLQQQGNDKPLTPFMVFDVHGSFEERGGSSSSSTTTAASTDTSISNPMEVDDVVWLLKRLMQQRAAAGASGAAPLSVGVITPYRRQVAAILEQCSPAGVTTNASSSGGGSSSGSSSSRLTTGSLVVDVRSVDGFQGQERDVIIFSAVRANSQCSIGFLSDARRLNVALTRARHMLAVVCNARTVSADATWAALLTSARARGLLRVLGCGGEAEGSESSSKLLSSLRARLQQRQWQEQLMRGGAQLFSNQKCPWQVRVGLLLSGLFCAGNLLLVELGTWLSVWRASHSLCTLSASCTAKGKQKQHASMCS